MKQNYVKKSCGSNAQRFFFGRPLETWPNLEWSPEIKLVKEKGKVNSATPRRDTRAGAHLHVFGRWASGWINHDVCDVWVKQKPGVKVKVKVHTLDIASLRSESPLQKRSGMARVLKGFHSFTCTPTRSSTVGISHICLCLPSRSWYSFTDPGRMEGWVDLGAKLPRLRFEPATSRLRIRHSTTQPLGVIIGVVVVVVAAGAALWSRTAWDYDVTSFVRNERECCAYCLCELLELTAKCCCKLLVICVWYRTLQMRR